MKEMIFLACIAYGSDPNAVLSCQVFQGTELACVQMLHEKLDRMKFRQGDERVNCTDMRSGFAITGRT